METVGDSSPLSSSSVKNGRYRDSPPVLPLSTARTEQMFSSRLNQSSLLYGPLEELQELAFIERPIRRSLKVFYTDTTTLGQKRGPGLDRNGVLGWTCVSETCGM